MLVSNSVIRRYTPPTCTLQLVARSSLLSRWIGQSVLKQLQFELKFDDPRLPEEKRVSIQGDREQLEILHEAIANYIQDLLKQSPERFNAVLSGGLAPPSSNTAASLKPPIGLITSDSQALSEESLEDSLVTQNEAIFLQPGRGLSHDLYLGSLANEESGALIRLSVLQLFDLATALDEYAVDVVALPTESPRRRIADTTTQTWGSIAAVLVLAVGLVGVVQRFNRSDSQQQIANNSTTSGSSSNNNQQSNALGPSLTPTLSPLQIPSSLPPVGSTLQPPSSPSFPTGTLPGTSSPFNSARQTNSSQTTLVIPGTPREKIPQKTPTNSTPRGTSATTIVINPEPQQQKRSVSSPKNAAQKTTVVPPPSPPVTQPSPSSQSSPATPGLASVPSDANPVNPPASESNATAQQSPAAITATAPEQPNGRLFDTPQTAAARKYFEQRWEPPSGLAQPLEYRLTVGVNGTIQRIEPLGQQAGVFLDRTDIPLPGESFVSPDTNGKTHIIRLILFPDGKVETLSESRN